MSGLVTSLLEPLVDSLLETQSAPSGYSVMLDKAAYFQGSANDLVSFTFTDAEIGTTYDYSISSSGGGTPLTDSGTISAADQTISNIDISSLPAGTLTLSVTLTNGTGTGSPATDTAQIAAGGVAWFDFADSSTVTQATGKVSQIDSKLGSSINASQTTDALRPIYQLNAVHNLNAARFRYPADLVTRYLETNNITLADATPEYTVYVVTYPVVTAMENDLARIFENDSDFDEATLTTANANASFRIRTLSQSVAGTVGLVTNAVNIIMAKLATGGSVSLYKNNATIATGTGSSPAPTAPASYRIGEGIAGSNRGWGGYICEIIMFNKAHDESVRQAILARLTSKWIT